MLQIRVYKKKSLIHVLVNDRPQQNIYTEHNMICVSDCGTILMIRKICFQSSVVYLGTISEFLFLCFVVFFVAVVVV